MNAFKLKSISYPFSKRERDALELLCNCYLRYNQKVASFLYVIMGKDPKDTDYKLDFSNLDFKWFYEGGDSSVLGAWNMTEPNTIYVNSLSPHNTDNWKDKTNSLSEPKDKYYSTICSLLINFGTIMHEFYHMFQFKTAPAAYVAMRFITLITRLPYYFVRDENMLQAYNKIVEWDLEGQAMKYGDNAEGIDYFILTLDKVFSSLHSDATRPRLRQSYFDSLVQDRSIPNEFAVYGKELIDLYLKEK